MKNNKWNKRNWVGSVSRDLVALGSVPFFILVLARVWILDLPSYFAQFFIAGLLVIFAFFLFKANVYAGLSLVILFFTANFYQERLYTFVGSVAYLLLLASLSYLQYDKKKIVLGILAAILGIVLVFVVV